MIHMFSIYDKKTETYGDPFAVAHGEIAIRGFNEATNTPTSFIGKNPFDFQLVKVGTFDQNSGEMIPLSAPLVVFQNKPE